MPIKCPHCGYDANRDKARFCRQCGQRLPSPQLPQRSQRPVRRGGGPTQPPGLPQPQAPRRPAPAGPLGKPARPLASRLSAALIGGGRPLVAGTVTVSDERRDRPPTDWYRVLFISSLALMFSPLIALAAGMVMVLLCFVPAVGVIISILLAFLRRRPTSQEVPIYQLGVEDPRAGQIVNVEMIGRRTGGGIEVGDEVEVYGRWRGPAAGGSVWAWKIRVVQRYSSTQGHKVSSGAVVKARRPFPRLVALGTFVLAAMSILGTCTGLAGQ